jgi:Family of unknown function (DUF6494)
MDRAGRDVAQHGEADLLQPLAKRNPERRVEMNEDRFNMDIRKFLKIVGVTSQREIEAAVRVALGKGRLADAAVLRPRVRLTIPEIGLDHVIDGEIGLA